MSDQVMSNSLISKLNDDCLEVVFQCCGGCPYTLSAIALVCRRWYSISQYKSVWRTLTIDQPQLYAGYARLLHSGHKHLESVRYLSLYKSIETRHAHLRSLPLESLKNLTHLYTHNLCLAEIDHLSRQITTTPSQLSVIHCTHIETWCDTQRFTFDIVERHPQLHRIKFKFVQDGHNGFASIHNYSITILPIPMENMHVRNFCLASVVDSEWSEQRLLLGTMAEIEKDQGEALYQEEIDMLQNQRAAVMNSWFEYENTLVEKYTYLFSLSHLEELEIGFCYAWTPKVWRQFRKVLYQSKHTLGVLSLHGWDQLGKLGKKGFQSTTIQPIRMQAEMEICECLSQLYQLKTLQLVNFSIGVGLLKAAPHLSREIQSVNIVYTDSFIRNFNEPADIWLLMGPLEEFATTVFKDPSMERRHLKINLSPLLQAAIKNNLFFKNKPFIDTLKKSLLDQSIFLQYEEVVAQ